jgi:hypothetical protein
METQQGGRGLVTVRNLPQLLQHSPVSSVHTIEGSHGQHRAWLAFRNLQKIRCVEMHSHFTKLGAEIRPRRTIFEPDFIDQIEPQCPHKEPLPKSSAQSLTSDSLKE